MNRLETLKNNWSYYESKVQAYEASVPATPMMREIYENILQIAAANNVFVSAPVFKNPTARDGYSDLPFEITIEGSYGGVLNTLETLQQGPRMLNIRQLTIQKGDVTEVKAVATIEAYYQSARQAPANNKPAASAKPNQPQSN